MKCVRNIIIVVVFACIGLWNDWSNNASSTIIIIIIIIYTSHSPSSLSLLYYFNRNNAIHARHCGNRHEMCDDINLRWPQELFCLRKSQTKEYLSRLPGPRKYSVSNKNLRLVQYQFPYKTKTCLHNITLACFVICLYCIK